MSVCVCVWSVCANYIKLGHAVTDDVPDLELLM